METEYVIQRTVDRNQIQWQDVCVFYKRPAAVTQLKLLKEASPRGKFRMIERARK